MKTFITVLFGLLFLGYAFSVEAAQCPGNSAGGLGMADPACWTEYWVSDKRIENCTWSEIGREHICVPCHPTWGCNWSAEWTTTGSCGSDKHYADNVFLSDECGHSTTWCTNVGMPAVHTKEVDNSHWDYECNYFTVDTWGECTDGIAAADSISWHTKAYNPATCTNDSITKDCCATPTASLNINGSTATQRFDQEENFTLNWNFSIEPFYYSKYSCTLMTPTGSSLNPKPYPLSSFSSNILDAVMTLDDYSNASTLYTYNLHCDGGSSVCVDTDNAVSVQIDALPFELNPATGATAEPNPAEIGDPVIWTAHPRGGYPPYIYTWTGDVTGNTKSLSKRYVDTGPKSATVRVQENGGSWKEASASTVIQNTRTSQ